MFGLGNSAEVKRQQHQDHLRRAEQQRLAQEAAVNREKLAVLQSIGHQLFGLIDRKHEENRVGTRRLSEKSI